MPVCLSLSQVSLVIDSTVFELTFENFFLTDAFPSQQELTKIIGSADAKYTHSALILS
jgi:hypothetical protein